MAVFKKIEAEQDLAVKKELSLKHQVLCDETAIIGVMKQTDKATGELKETTIQFGTDSLIGHMPPYNQSFGCGAQQRMLEKCAFPMMRSMATAPQEEMKKSADIPLSLKRIRRAERCEDDGV